MAGSALEGREDELAHASELLASDGTWGLVLTGEAGVGKTALAMTLLDRLAETGHPTHEVFCSEASIDVPLGCLTRMLLDGDDGRVGDASLSGAVAAMLRLAEGPLPLVVLIDDLPFIDAVSALAVLEFFHSGRGMLVATARDDHVLPPYAEPLTTAPSIAALPVAPLSVAAAEAVLVRMLDARPSDDARDRLLESARGNPLLLRELTTHAGSSGALQREAEGYTLAADYDPAPALGEAIAARLRGISPEAQRAFESLAVLGGLDVRLAREAGLLAGIDELETSGLVTVRDNADRHLIEATHPLYLEALAGSLSQTRRIRIVGDLLDVARRIRVSEALELRLTMLALETDHDLEPAVLVRCAELAQLREDHRLAVALGRAALGHQESRATPQLLALSLLMLSEHDQALEVLGQGVAGAIDPSEAIELQCIQARVLVYAGRPTEALRVLELTRGQDLPPELAVRVELITSELDGMRGEWSMAHRRSRAVFDRRDRLSVTDCYLASVLCAISASFNGPYRELQEPLNVVAEPTTPTAWTRHFHIWHQLAVATEACLGGRALEALERCEAGAGDAAAGLAAPEFHGWWRATQGILAGFTGNVDDRTAIVVNEGRIGLERIDPGGLLSFAVANSAVIAAMVRDHGAALYYATLYDETFRPIEFKTTAHGDRARAWIAALEGDLDLAAELTLVACAEAQSVSATSYALFMAYDAIRFLRPDVVLDPLADYALRMDAPLGNLLHEHAVRLARGDGRGLAEVSVRIEDAGCCQFAAEALASAIDTGTLRGRELDRARHRLRRLSALFSAPTPALLQLDHDGTRGGRIDPTTTLTARQLEVARLAADGLTSADIADQLYISTRTVDNHLASVFQALDVHARQELVGRISPVDVSDRGYRAIFPRDGPSRDGPSSAGTDAGQ